MITTIPLPDGYVVTLQLTSNGNAPDSDSRLSLNDSALWIRLVRPGWDSGWHKSDRKSLGVTRVWWDIVATAADIPEAWCQSTGQQVWPPPRYDDVYWQGVNWLNNIGAE